MINLLNKFHPKIETIEKRKFLWICCLAGLAKYVSFIWLLILNQGKSIIIEGSFCENIFDRPDKNLIYEKLELVN